ncbi:hypothetical protein ACFL20_01890 [Spirochaetota bacterium]
MPRAKIWGLLAVIVSICLAGLFIYSIFIININKNISIENLNDFTYFAIAFPIAIVSSFVIGTGFWIGWTILTIKVVPPMADIIDKPDNSKIKAFFLCLATLGLAGLLIYGIIIKNFWALAIPAAIITLVILGAIFWVGIAILTTRSTLPDKQ